MHFSHLHPGSGNRAGKFALVAGLHALVAVGVVNMMNNKSLPLPSLPTDLTVFTTPEPPKPPPTPPEPPTPQQQLPPPKLFVPKPDFDIPLPPIENPIRATTELPPPRETAQPARAEVRVEAPSQPAKPTTNPGTMRSAVLADAKACVTPNYPAAAARNGDTGTVTLALLVGLDGRVTSARVQSSSGSRELDRAAVNALSLCQFKPAMNNGVPEAGWAQIAYVWSLE
jgi:protein TonB